MTNERLYWLARKTTAEELEEISADSLRAVFDAVVTELAIRYSWETVQHSITVFLEADVADLVVAEQIRRMEASLDA